MVQPKQLEKVQYYMTIEVYYLLTETILYIVPCIWSNYRT
jgi:hypothetical protein